MRSVSSGALSASLQNVRIVSSRLVIKDHRLRFYDLNKSSISLGSLKSYDAAEKSGSIYEVANYNNTLYYRYISNPGGSWPGWSNSGRSLKANSRPGLYQNRVFYQESGGTVKYSDLNGSSLGGANSYSGFPISGTLSIAPIGSTKCVMRDVPSASSTFAKVMQTNPAGYTWEGHIYGNTDLSLEYFDAETDENGWTYVFWSEGKSRLKYMKYQREWEPWSNVMDVIPMDVVDDLNTFAFGGVTRRGSVGSGTDWPLEGNLWIGGALARTDMGNMQMYTVGPPWSAGRDIFVGTDGATSAPYWGGKIHFVGSNVYYIGPSSAYRASGTDWTGDSSPSTTIYDIASVNFTQEQNNSAKLIVEIPYDTSSSTVRQGSDVIWYARVQQHGGSIQEIKMGTFNIDMILESHNTGGKAKTIVARSRSVKELQMWRPDTSFDYWGSDTKVSDPAELSEVIRLDGHWDGSSGYLVNNEMNKIGDTVSQEKLGLMYSTARPSRGAIAKMKFKFDSDSNLMPIMGVGLNYYNETKEEAAVRTGATDPNTVNWWYYGRSYLLFGWGPTQHSGSDGWMIRNIEDGQWSVIYPPIASGALYPSANTWYWIMAQYREGKIFYWWRANSTSTWTLLHTETFEEDNKPWFNVSNTGRAALFSHNETLWIYKQPFNSDAQFLPFVSRVSQNGGVSMPTNALYRVDEELIQVTNILGNAASSQDNDQLIECALYPKDNQPIPEPSFTPPANSYPVWGEYITSPTAVNTYNDMVLVVTSGPGTGNVYEIADNGWNHEAPTQWVPTGGVYTPTNPNWMDYIGVTGHGTWSWRTSRIYLKEDPRGAIRPGSHWRLCYKGVCTRGANNTDISSHPGVGADHKLSVEASGRTHIDDFHVFTDEKEWNMEMMITEIAKKAGVKEVSSKKHLDRTITRSSGSWDLNGQMSSYGVRHANFVVRARIISGSKVGVQFGRIPSWSGGYCMYVEAGSPANAVLMTSSGTILEKIPLGNTPYPVDGWLEFSVQGDSAKVYRQGALAAAFKLPEEIDTQSWSGPAVAGATGRYDWPELSMRVDNFIMDIGQKGSALLNRLIGQKRIYYQDDQDGNLRIYKDRTTVTSTPYNLTLTSGYTMDESSIATRVRAEGGDAAMAIDEDALREHGNIFMVANAEDVMTKQDAIVEAEWILDELKKRASQYNLVGACDPRVEAGDIIPVMINGVEKDIAVDAVKIIMDVSETNARFDMSIEGHDAYS